MKLPNGYGSVTKLSGKRRNPYMVRKTKGYRYDEESDKYVQEYVIIGYAKTKADGLRMLAEYNDNPYDEIASKMTFSDIYSEWSKQKFPTISHSNIVGYTASYKACVDIYNKKFKDIKLKDLQDVIDNCGKNYPTLKKIKVLFNQLYDFALKNDICHKNYSDYVDIAKYKDRNPNKYDRNKFEPEEIERIWLHKDDMYYQIILMLIYNGTRISEFLNLKKENVHLEEQYFDVISSKTENGIRKVPIADKVLPFYRSWYFLEPKCSYLLHTPDGKHFVYRNYYDSYFIPLMEQLDISRTPHCCRHTCISLLADAGVEPSTIKKIVGHSGAMNVTERVYMHLDIQTLIDAINKI